MRRLLNFDVSSYYPNEVRVFGYSSRAQADKEAYVKLLQMRMDAKHGKLPESFLKPLRLTNDALKDALKLIINSYTGTLRAPFNALCDWKQGVAICFTAQLLMLQLAHDLSEIPTVELAEANTDAICFYIDDEYIDQAYKVINDWQELTKLELEEDNIVKYIARDVNNYVEMVQTKKGYKINYKGGLFTGKHIFEWDEENRMFHYTFKDSLTSNSLTICAEAILKNLLFGNSVEDIINNCNDVNRFQMITHLGGTYEKMVVEHKDGTQEELQRNNRIYAGKKKTGDKIYKIKSDGTKSILPMCPTNPIVDNENKITIDKINKEWYIKYTKQRISDFVGKGEIIMDEKITKLKKDELIELAQSYKEELDSLKTNNKLSDDTVDSVRMALPPVRNNGLYSKIQELRNYIRNRNFILDKVLPNNLGSGEYVSIEQYYSAIQDGCMSVGLDFSFEVVNLERFDIDAFKPAGKPTQHISTVKCIIELTDIETGDSKHYVEISQGSDILDKGVNGASTFAFRNWFDKNFTPRVFNGKVVNFGDEGNTVTLDSVNIPNEVKTEIKPKVFIPTEKKEEIKKEVVTTPQTDTDKNDTDALTELIYTYREKSGKQTAGAKTLDAIINGTITAPEVLSKTLSFQNALDKLGE